MIILFTGHGNQSSCCYFNFSCTYVSLSNTVFRKIAKPKPQQHKNGKPDVKSRKKYFPFKILPWPKERDNDEQKKRYALSDCLWKVFQDFGTVLVPPM